MNPTIGDTIQYGHLISHKSGASEFHLHDFYELYLLIDGDLNFFIHQSCYHIRAGSLLLINDLEIHKAANLSNKPHNRIHIHIPQSFFNKYSTDKTRLQSCFHDRAPGERNLLNLTDNQTAFFIKQFNAIQETHNSGQFASELLMDTYLLQLLIMVNGIFQDKSLSDTTLHNYPLTVSNIISYIDDHIMEKLTLDHIAEHLSNDKYYICHTFKKETGTTIFSYILLKRIAIAKILLSEGKSVTEACYQSGFGDYTNFITSFRKVTGYTPKKFRDMKALK